MLPYKSGCALTYNLFVLMAVNNQRTGYTSHFEAFLVKAFSNSVFTFLVFSQKSLTCATPVTEMDTPFAVYTRGDTTSMVITFIERRVTF